MENGCHSIRINGVWEFSRCGELNFFARLGNALSRLRHAGRMPALQNKFRRSSPGGFRRMPKFDLVAANKTSCGGLFAEQAYIYYIARVKRLSVEEALLQVSRGFLSFV